MCTGTPQPCSLENRDWLRAALLRESKVGGSCFGSPTRMTCAAHRGEPMHGVADQDDQRSTEGCSYAWRR